MMVLVDYRLINLLVYCVCLFPYLILVEPSSTPQPTTEITSASPAPQPTTENTSPSPAPQPTTENTSLSSAPQLATEPIWLTTVSTQLTSNQASTDLTNTQETMANVSTACFSPQRLPCTEHKLSCTGSLVISITNITFGYRQGCNNGLYNCSGNTTCCREETGDCFTPYNQTLLSQLQQTCNERQTCTLDRYNGLDEVSGYCFNGIALLHSYSKIEYHCSAIEITVSTACFSPQVLPCTEHALSCTDSLFVSITNITFGYRQGCNNGLYNCSGDTACCREETGDCFTPYNPTLLSQLQQTCSGRFNCTLDRYNGLDEVSGYCFNGTALLHSYSKIEYHCSALVTEATVAEAADSETLGGAVTANVVDELAIVGGVLGAIVFICLVTIIILVAENRKLSHQLDDQHDSVPSRFRDESLAVYTLSGIREKDDGKQ